MRIKIEYTENKKTNLVMFFKKPATVQKYNINTPFQLTSGRLPSQNGYYPLFYYKIHTQFSCMIWLKNICVMCS